MGTLGDIAQKAKEQIQARAVAEGRKPASEMYADQRQVAADKRRQESQAQAEADAEDTRRRRAAAAAQEAQESHDSGQERKAQRHQEFQGERATQKAKREKTTREEKFKKGQEEWNLQKKQQYAHEKYTAEQEPIVKSRQMPTFGQRVTASVGTAAGDAIFDVMHPKKPAKQPRGKASKGSRIVTPQHSILDEFAGQPKTVVRKRKGGRSKSTGGRRRAVVVQRVPARRDPFDIDIGSIF